MTWDCADGTPDEDHDWERIHDWYGDPGVINGTCDFTFLRCKQCGKEIDDEGQDINDGPDPDYERDRKIDAKLDRSAFVPVDDDER